MTPQQKNAQPTLIDKIHQTDGQFSLAITGGGTSAIAALFGVAGASRTVLEASVPYHSDALASYVSASSSQSCNNPTARAMAMVAFQRATQMSTKNRVFGLGCTAAIATDRTRRGSDRCHVALQSDNKTKTWDLILDKTLSREAQEARCAELIIDVMAEALGIKIIPDDQNLVAHHQVAPTAWQALLAGTIKSTHDKVPACVFPGAFNPFHEGHRGMLEVAEAILGERPALEVSIRNVDKPPLDYLSMSERGVDEYPMIFTNAPTFLEKSALFPGVTFIVGADTITRIDDVKYYASVEAKLAAFELMTQRSVTFLVFGRQGGQLEDFISLANLTLSPALMALCKEVPETKFRQDISSTDLRERQMQSDKKVSP